MSSSSRPNGRVCCMSWNDSGTCVAVGLNDSFIIYSTESIGGETGPYNFTEIARRPIVGGVGHIALYQQFNLLIFSGIREPQNRTVTLWDDTYAQSAVRNHGFLVQPAPSGNQCALAEFTVQTPIVALRLNPKCIIVAEETVMHLFDDQLNLIDSYQSPVASASFGQGEPAMHMNDNCIAMTNVLVSTGAVPILMVGPSPGSLLCIHLFPSTGSGGKSGKSTVRCKLLNPHTRPIRCITMSADGTMGATISENGTAIKLIDVVNMNVLRQFNRGTTPNAVYTMNFSSDNSGLACLSETGTLHYFSMQLTVNPKSKANILSGAASYLPTTMANSKWVSNTVSFISSEYALVTFSLVGEGSNSSVADDVEAEENEAFSKSFVSLAFKHGNAGHPGSYNIHVVQGSGTDADQPADQGVTGFSGPRCKFSRLLLQTYGNGKCEKVSTHFFPKEEL